METKNEKIRLGEQGFWPLWISKLLYTLISVKVWGLVAATWISTSLLVNHFIDKGQWLTFNTTIWALIFGMKEIFRIAENRGKAEKENLQRHLDSKVKIASLNAEGRNGQQPLKKQNQSGFEIVGEEPELKT